MRLRILRIRSAWNAARAGIYVALSLAAAFAKTGCAPPGAVDGGAAAAVTRPHIVLVIADDMGWGDLAAHGNLNLATPHLDALHARGMSFANFYVSAVCSPTRAELLTGRHALELGVTGVSAGRERMDTSAATIADVLAQAGYRTGLFGKWHNGSQGAYHPLSRGFDAFYGFTSGHWGSYFDYFVEDGDSLARFAGYLPDVLTDRVVSFLAGAREAPTFAVLSFPTPHSPMQVPEPYWAPARPLPARGTGEGPEDETFTRAALAMVENLDANVGRLVAALDSLGIAEDTYVAFTSDNGPNSWRWNADMAGKKGTVDEGGVRAPLIVAGPGIAAGQADAVVSARDLLPTLAELAGVPRSGKPAGSPLAELIAGRSVVSLLSGDAQPLAEELAARPVPSEWAGEVSVRSGDYRLAADGHLYDMRDDRAQARPVEAEYPRVDSALRWVAATFAEEYVRPYRRPDTRPFTVGYAGRPRTWLPARDAEPGAGSAIARSSRWPNDSYFEAWGDAGAQLEWDVEVARAGRYGVRLYYALAEGQAGAVVELGGGGAEAVRQVLAEAYPAQDRGAGRDRYVRDESPVRDWGVAELGEVELGAGAQALTLRVPQMPGGEGPAVWGVALEHPRG